MRQSHVLTAAQRHAARRRYEQVIDRYLSDCYAGRTVARVSELADLMAWSRSHLSRVIPHLFGGRTLRDILREKQIEEAKRLLRVTPLSTSKIAAASAFGDRSTLFRVFRREVGMTPDEYRREVTNCDSRNR